jgi:hypothetical protein
MRQREGSYASTLQLVRQQVRKTKGTFTIRSIYEPLKRQLIRASVASALRRLRDAGEIVVVKKGIGGKEMVLTRQT